MVDFTFKGKTVQIPSTLEELNKEQYIEFLKLSGAMMQGYVKPDTFRVKWISYLLGLKADYTIYRPEIVEEVKAQLDKLDGFFIYNDLESGGRSVTPRLRTGRQMLREFAGWIGPGDMLDGMTFGDFTDCLTLAAMAKKATEEGQDDKEIGEIYEEMTRKIYRPREQRKDTTGLEKPVPPSLLVLHSVNLFSAVWTQILNEPVEINGEAISFAILFNPIGNQGRAGVNDKTGWQGITFEVASSGVFGNVQDVNRASFWDVLLYLYKCKFEHIHNKPNSTRRS